MPAPIAPTADLFKHSTALETGASPAIGVVAALRHICFGVSWLAL
jgi:hypothetical protein